MSLNLAKSLVYVARDIERALGLEPAPYGAGEYVVVSNDTPYGREVQKKYPKNVFLVKGDKLLDTYDLLLFPEVEEIISSRKADLLVFQNTSRIERLAQKKGWHIANPPAAASKEIEEKISQTEWLGNDAKLLPPHRVAVLKDARFEGKRFVLQFNHSHTGGGTFVIDSADDLADLQAKFPERECRIADFIEGPVFTVNALVCGAEIVVGNPSYQITGLAPFTDARFSTIGNDWALPQKKEYAGAYKDVGDMARAVGARLKLAGWRGLFGIDAIFDEKAGKTYLLEINARQPASAVFESSLQKAVMPNQLSIFEAHLAALLGQPLPQSEKAPAAVSGAQIVKRVTKKSYDVDMKDLRSKGLSVIEYENAGHNKELFRIQSTTGIMESHEKLNALGKSIASCIKPKKI